MTANTPSFMSRWPLLEHDQARLEYARLLWRRPSARARLIRHWTDPRHPHSERFVRETRALVERILEAGEECDARLDSELKSEGRSLRTAVREIPPVFGSFY